MIKLYFSNIFAGQTLLGLTFSGLVFFALPGLTALHLFFSRYQISDDALALILSSFSIFSAMLFASQIAAFNVFSFKVSEVWSRNTPTDEIQKEAELSISNALEGNLRFAFRRINGGISGLTIVAVLTVLVCITLASGVVDSYKYAVSAILAFFVLHFLLIFLKICVQVFAFFDAGYHDFSK